MRWSFNEPLEGTRRTVKKFLIFPRRFYLKRGTQNVYEWHWLESVCILQEAGPNSEGRIVWHTIGLVEN
jgi:hypothetical protein